MARLRNKTASKGPLVERVLEDGTIIIGRIAKTTITASAETTPPEPPQNTEHGPVRGRIVKRRLPNGDFIYGRIASKK